MSTIMPQGENIRKAVKWISDEKQCGSGKNLQALIDEAAAKFNLSPKDMDFLERFVQEECLKK